MHYKKLGNTGLDVSAVCLGCMSYGDPSRGTHPWTLDEEKSRPFIRQAIELGINFFDSANSYSDGTSEEIVGRALKDFGRRDELVVATKVFFGGDRPNRRGLSRKAILTAIDDSLRRLGMDYVDLYQIHRWDYGTPIEETLETLNDIVRAGKARYIGASSMHAWQFMKALSISRHNGWATFATMQNHLNLLYREEEREMLPLCLDQGIGVIPWSPLARGRLTRDWNETSERAENDSIGEALYRATAEADKRVVDAVTRVSTQRGVPRAQVALAWIMQKAGVTAPIVGATKLSHLEDAVAALSIRLDGAEIAALEEPYVPHLVVGFN
jgi:aryl-alcohol dehydrogenase-like predicted oxidoreductase